MLALLLACAPELPPAEPVVLCRVPRPADDDALAGCTSVTEADEDADGATEVTTTLVYGDGGWRTASEVRAADGTVTTTSGRYDTCGCAREQAFGASTATGICDAYGYTIEEVWQVEGANRVKVLENTYEEDRIVARGWSYEGEDDWTSEGSSDTWTYDAEGHVVELWEFRGMDIRTTRWTWADDRILTVERTPAMTEERRTYDEVGRLATVSTDWGMDDSVESVRTYVYDDDAPYPIGYTDDDGPDGTVDGTGTITITCG